MVCIKFTRLFEAVIQQVENDQSTAALQYAVSRTDSALRMDGMMQRLAQNCQFDAVFRNRGFFDVSKTIFKVVKSMFFRQF